MTRIETASQSVATGNRRIGLGTALAAASFDPAALSPFQRVLMTTDGTVTEILAAYFLENIRICKLHEEVTTAQAPMEGLGLGAGEALHVREILLQGIDSGRNYVHAYSFLAPARLPPDVQQALRETNKPIGQVSVEARMETFREIMSCELRPGGEVMRYFGLAETEPTLTRTYRIYSGRLPVMQITENFPQCLYR